MAKTGLLGGNGQTPPIFANTSPVFSDPGSVFRRGEGGILPERGSRAQYDMVQALLQSGVAASRDSGSPLLAFLAPMVGGAVGARTEGLYRGAQEGRDNDAIDQLLASMGPGASSPSVSTRGPTPTTAEGTPRNAAMAAYGGPTNAAAAAMEGGDGSVASGIVETAQALGMNPVDLATIISYETGGTFNPTMSGPTTQWGTHRGLIQFGEPQARQYGVNWDDPVGSQLGADGAVARYFRQNGWQPGMSLLDAYSIVNAGGPGLYDRSDANNGGAPGTVRDKVENQMGGHRENAMRLLGGDFSAYATAGQPAPMSQDNMRTLIGLMTNPDVSAPIRDLAGSMMTDAMGSRNGLSPSDQIGLARDMLGLEAALAPPPPEPRFRVATPEEAASYGAEAGQIGPDGRFYPSPAGNSSGDAGVLRQRNEATTIIGEAVADLQTQGYSREEALGMVARDPIYGSQFQILGVDPADIARAQVAATAEAAQNDVGFWGRIFGRDAAPAPAAPVQPAAPTPDNDPLGLR